MVIGPFFYKYIIVKKLHFYKIYICKKTAFLRYRFFTPHIYIYIVLCGFDSHSRHITFFIQKGSVSSSSLLLASDYIVGFPAFFIHTNYIYIYFWFKLQFICIVVSLLQDFMGESVWNKVCARLRGGSCSTPWSSHFWEG